MMRKLLLTIGIALVAIGCTKNADVSSSGDNALTITSNIATRVADGEWEENDAIGVYMTSYENVEYTTANGDGVFTSTSPIYLPSDGTAVDIFAYYPYVESVDLTTYSIKSAEQVDLLSASASNITSPNVALEFNHLLSKVSLTIEAGYGVEISDLAGLKVTLSGIGTEATFNLNSDVATTTNSASELTFSTESDGTSSSAIVIPQTLSGATLTFATDDYTYSATLATSEFKVGYEYTYTATINNDEVEITSSNISGWDGDESATTGTATIVDIEKKDDGKYYINSAKGLAAFRSLVNLNGSNSEKATFAGFEESKFTEANTEIDGVLTCNIDLSDICGEAVGDGGTSWSTIGYYSDGNCYYAGKFDGGGHEISGLYINTSANQQALFRGISSTGVVCNLGVSGTAKNTSTTFTEFGGITAYNNGNIFNCYTDIEIDGSYITSVGGIAAYNSSTGKVVNCYNLNEVVGKVNIGGIVGFNQGGYVGYCFNTGAVSTSTGQDNGSQITGTDTYIKYGGVVGYNDDSGIDSNTDTVKGSFCLSTTDYSIGQAAKTADSGTLNTNVCTADYLTSATFTTTMNNGAATYNSTYTTSDTPTYITACAWVYNDGDYPTHNFYEEPKSVDLDIIYNSVNYTINTANGLLAFAALVNGTSDLPDGLVTSSNATSETNDVFFQFGTVHSNIGGKLANNISLDSGTSITIGINEYPYIGTFDFNDKTITMDGTTYSSADSGLFYTTD
ncbi:MAG: fimbrillin family protein [Rikenellaceae bacterium]